ncbi:HAF repeat-containing protein [Telluria beijingensis]|uniref:HAF repeat-containing protein n=1 Tax=Telluria beijingensis TaxID=3068633 RepID=UPI0027957429|nr:HAF repeat-containing protein [Massilia sp. REN29]
MHLRHRLSLVLMSFTLAGAASAYPEYKVTVVGPANSTATDINSAGVVVGYYQYAPSVNHAFLNRGKGLVDLGTLKGTDSIAVAINDKGQVLGHWSSGPGTQRGFLYDCARIRDLGTIGGRSTNWHDINNAGYIAVSAVDAPLNDGTTSYLRAPGGALTALGDLPNDFPDAPPLTFGQALNNKNQVAGESGPLTFPDQPLHAFIWTKGKLRDLGSLGQEPMGAQAINDRGQATGYASVQGGFRNRVAFYYSRGHLVDIDGRPASEERFSDGTGINNRGHIVGSSNHLSGFIWRGKKMQSLNALINPALGWDIRDPQAINDAGQIAANAFRNGVRYAVRLDLIKPHVDAVAPAEHDEEPAVEAPLSAAAAAKRAREEAEGVAKEVAKPVAQ